MLSPAIKHKIEQLSQKVCKNMESNTADLIVKFKGNIAALALSADIRRKLENNFSIIEDAALRYDSACVQYNTQGQEKYKFAHDALVNANVMLDTIMMVAQNAGGVNLIEHVFKSGHVTVKNDGGSIKKLLDRSNRGNYRFSTHHNKHKSTGNLDIGMQAYKIFNEGLFGNQASHGDGIWFQMEDTSTTGRTLFETIYNILAHLLVDFCNLHCNGQKRWAIWQFRTYGQKSNSGVIIILLENITHKRDNLLKKIM